MSEELKMSVKIYLLFCFIILLFQQQIKNRDFSFIAINLSLRIYIKLINL